MLNSPKTIRILGLDPGLRHTGWGLISVTGNVISYLNGGVIKPPTKETSLSLRLLALHQALYAVLEKTAPDEAVVEETFMNNNPASAIKLGMARGIVLMAPSQFGVPVFEYTANVIKKSVVGSGHADKQQVAHMVKRLLPTSPETLSADASDALAIALCHVHHRNLKRFTAA